MLKRNFLLFLFIALLIVACGSDDSQTQDSISIQMIDYASERIININSDAFILWVGGKCKDNELLSDPSETNDWAFVADTINDNNGELAWLIRYDGIWEIIDLNIVINEIVYTDLSNVEMDVSRAWELAQEAGFTSPFYEWVLFQRLHPTIDNPYFVFNTQEYGFVFVDTISNNVWHDSLNIFPIEGWQNN